MIRTRYLTETGSYYDVWSNGVWSKNGGSTYSIWEYGAVPDWEHERSQVVREGLVTYSRRVGDLSRFPAVGECLYIYNRDVWWLSTRVMKIETFED